MSTPDNQAYAQGYHVGYQHGFEAAQAQLRGQGGGGNLPPNGESHAFNVVGRYPERSSRLLMFFLFFRGFLLVPHLVCLWFLSIAVGFIVVVSWFAVVITGNYPKALWDFMTGFIRWTTRVQTYAIGLTDEYPPFSLN